MENVFIRTNIAANLKFLKMLTITSGHSPWLFTQRLLNKYY